MTASLSEASNCCFYFYGSFALPLGQLISAQLNKNDFLVTSLAERKRMNAYALRVCSIGRCSAVPNLNTYGDVTKRIEKMKRKKIRSVISEVSLRKRCYK